MSVHTFDDEKKLGSPEIDYAPSSPAGSEIDLLSYHEVNAGRLIIDPEEAKIELGEKVASQLKLTKDGTKVLWPQPTDDPNDPQNWSDRQKALHLFIMTVVAVVPDLVSGTGTATLFAIAKEFHTTTTKVNDMSTTWSIFLLGAGSLPPVVLMRRYGRLPVLFWTQVLALIFSIVLPLSPNLNTYTAMRLLQSFFATAPQVTGLYVVADLYPFHLQPRMLNTWTVGYLSAPFVGPFLFGFMVARVNWRWAYMIGAIYSAMAVLLIMFFMEETMYDRSLKPIPQRPTQGLRYRVETLLGITGVKMAKYRASWTEACFAPFKVVWRPHVIGMLLYSGITFGFSIGMTTTNNVILRAARPFGFGYDAYTVAWIYATPFFSIFIGEIIGRFMNDWIMNSFIKRNHGVFEVESRLWGCYLAITMYAIGHVLLGVGLQDHLNIGVVIIGWGLVEVSVVLNIVIALAYLNDCFPKNRGEVCALANVARAWGGFSVAFYQIAWSSRKGALQTFGVETAVASGLFLLVVPALQYYGRSIRRRYSM